MKTSLKVLALLFLVITITTSCKSDDDDDTTTNDNRFEKVNEGNPAMETLKDSEANLEWVNGTGGCFGAIVIPDGQCDGLDFAGYTDWRNPTPNEMSTLITEISERNMNLNYILTTCGFMSTSMSQWVMTENTATPGVITDNQPGNAGLRCVRNN